MTDWKQELADAEEAAGQLNALQRLDPLPDESTDLYAQAFGSFVLNPLQTDMATAEAEQVKQLLKKIDELNRQVADQNTVVDTLTNETDQLQVRVSLTPQVHFKVTFQHLPNLRIFKRIFLILLSEWC